MSANKTTQTAASVADHLARIDGEARRNDCIALAEWMAGATQEPPTMWGPSIVGFGRRHYRYESGREGDTCLVGFASRKTDICIYGLGMGDADEELLARLGKYKTGKGCLYLKRLADIDLKVLKQLVADALARKKPA